MISISWWEVGRVFATLPALTPPTLLGGARGRHRCHSQAPIFVRECRCSIDNQTTVDEMAKRLQRPAAGMQEAVGPSLLERVSWDDLRIFVVAARQQSFRKTATVLRTSSSTVVCSEAASLCNRRVNLVSAKKTSAPFA